MYLEHESTIELTANDVCLINQEQAWQYRILPRKTDSELIFFTDKVDNQLTKELEFIFDRHIQLVFCDSKTLEELLNQYYPPKEYDTGLRKYTGKADNFLHDLINEAKELKSSDIHIEAFEDRCRVRIRIDGQMAERYLLERDDYPAIINKIKIISGLDIAEKRLPQDGRINYKDDQYKFDIRASILPTLHGEKIVLRLLSNDATDIDIHGLGFQEDDLLSYLESVSRPNGMVLISGPTGSGKTTTLYATLKQLNKTTRNIITIEDPVEYTLEGINQVQLKESIGLTFPVALRTFLRQDPDIIMVGEIRDVETANMAIRASLTGHLVLSTIHTNSAWGTVSRLVDMGIPSFLVASTLNATVAQRLIRVLCPRCKKKEAFDNNLYPKKFKPYFHVAHHQIAEGCSYCHNTGYFGRKAIYEIIPIDRNLSEKIKSNLFDVDDDLKERKIKTLAENAFMLFANGDTTIQEIYPLLFNY